VFLEATLRIISEQLSTVAMQCGNFHEAFAISLKKRHKKIPFTNFKNMECRESLLIPVRPCLRNLTGWGKSKNRFGINIPTLQESLQQFFQMTNSSTNSCWVVIDDNKKFIFL
jgi:hypothetical protein